MNLPHENLHTPCSVPGSPLTAGEHGPASHDPAVAGEEEHHEGQAEAGAELLAEAPFPGGRGERDRDGTMGTGMAPWGQGRHHEAAARPRGGPRRTAQGASPRLHTAPGLPGLSGWNELELEGI